jgi:hypothetical protein
LYTLKPQRVDLPIDKIGSSDAALDTFLDAVLSFPRERVKKRTLRIDLRPSWRPL